MAEFAGRVAYFFTDLFGGREKPFKNYVTAACVERGYSNDMGWTVSGAYGKFGKPSTGNLDFHLNNVYKEVSASISGYKSAKMFAMRAADKICPDKSGTTRGSGQSTVTGTFQPAEVSGGRRVLHYSTVEGLQILLGLRRRAGHQNTSIRTMMRRGYYNVHTRLNFPQITLFRPQMSYVRP